ncbi:MAG: outer membrane lipoprotein-sorting protein [Terracidiphilus sp.]
MRRRIKLSFALLLASALLPARPVLADDLDKVLRRLDAAAQNFHSTQADFQFDSVTTDPVPDRDVQKGVVYYERKGAEFKMAAHIREINGKAVPKIYVYSGGTVRLYEKLVNQVTTLSKLSQYESWFMLGFGASGKELAEKWEIKYLGTEVLDGQKTDKLELVAKDPAIRKNIPKVTVWIDTETGVSRKQVFDEGGGQYRVSVYFNIKVNQPLPADAFVLKTDAKTTYVSR